MGATFAFSMFLETQATRQFVATVQARYLAEGGVSFARVILDEDRAGSRVDDEREAWVQEVSGSDADVDADGAREARWHTVTGDEGAAAGRYAVTISDEASKANLNAARLETSPLELGAINVTTVLQQAGFDAARAQEIADALVRYRNGDDERPGRGGIDDDGDGAIDEADEYQPLALQGDDRRLEGLEELAGIANVTAEELRRLSRFATVYSWDTNVSVAGKARVNVNTATASELLVVLLEAGVKDPWQAAANMADYVDADLEMSRVSKSAQRLSVPQGLPTNGWTWRDAPEGHYASERPGGETLVWSVEAPTGTFRLLAHGLEGTNVGDVTVAGQLKPSVDAGASLGTFSLDGTLEIRIDHREPAGTSCAFSGVELVSGDQQAGVTVRGIEAVRINELMVEPTLELTATEPTMEKPLGSDWIYDGAAALFKNAGTGQATWTWQESAVLGNQSYYVRVFGRSGQRVGQVRIGGQSVMLVDGARHPATLSVGADKKISLTIGKTESDSTYYFKGLALSLEPDGEYIELINLSEQRIAVGGWTIDGELAGGRQARLPAGAILEPHGLLVAAVDLEDQQAGLAGNGIDARSTWKVLETANAVELEFPSGPPSADDDWLKTSVPGGGAARLILRAGDVTVDEVQYAEPLPTTTAFQSLEKGDPTIVKDADLNGVDDGWFASGLQYTPGLANNNEGLKETVGLTTITHDPSAEVAVLNRPLAGVGELAGLPSGTPWRPFASSDLAKLVDRLTVEGMRLEAEGHLTAGPDAWTEKADGFYEYSSTQVPAVNGTWRWTNLTDGSYRLSLYSCRGCRGEQVAMRWERGEGAFSDWSPPLSTDAQGRVVVGQISIGSAEGTPSHQLVLEVSCASPNGVCHVDHIRLDPQLIRVGPINVNTAPRGVLLALPGMTEALADRIIAGRPYGDQDHKGYGIGDLLLGGVLGSTEQEKLSVFRQLAHLLTTRSDVFHILSLAHAMERDRAVAAQRIEAVVQR